MGLTDADQVPGAEHPSRMHREWMYAAIAIAGLSLLVIFGLVSEADSIAKRLEGEKAVLAQALISSAKAQTCSAKTAYDATLIRDRAIVELLKANVQASATDLKALDDCVVAVGAKAEAAVKAASAKKAVAKKVPVKKQTPAKHRKTKKR